MHLKITTTKYKGKICRYAKIVESFRDGKTVRQRVLKNIGRIKTKEDEENARRLLKQMQLGEKLVALNQIKIEKFMEFGVIYSSGHLWEKFGIRDVLNEALEECRARFDVGEIIFLLAVNRLHEPTSDLAAHEWIKKEAFVDARNIKLKHIYRALEQFIKRKEKIEAGIFKELQQRLGLKADLVFYDLTSSYFEGEGPELAEYGKSRDHRSDRKQLVLALSVIDGIPIAHEVFDGNTADKATLKHAVKKLKERFDIKRIIFVADRGLFSGKNIDFLDDEGYECILAMKRRRDNEVEELILAPIETDARVFAREVKREGNRRYILCFNKDTEQEQRKHLREVRRSLERELKELAESYWREGRGRKPSPENLVRKAFEILGKHKRLFDVKFDHGLKFSLNRGAWAYENAIAGRFLLVTTSDLTAKRIIESYKELRSVENAFKEIKNFVDIRPVYHFEDHMVKAHVFVCVLSYLTEALIQRLVSHQSARKTIQELKRIKVARASIDGEIVHFVNELGKEQRRVLKALKVEAPPRLIC